MKKTWKFAVIVKDCIDDMVVNVNTRLVEGWKLHGSTKIVRYSKSNSVEFFQAIKIKD